MLANSFNFRRLAHVVYRLKFLWRKHLLARVQSVLVASAFVSLCVEMKRKFQLPQVMPPPKIKIPRCADLRSDSLQKPAPPHVAKMLGDSALVVGVDIETHDWQHLPSKRGTYGQYGSYTIQDSDLSNVRIVQIGWAVLDGDNAPVTKARLIKPDGFVIAGKATAFHGISQDDALAHGGNLTDIMSEFIQELISLKEKGAKLVIHHLEYDATIISHELDRAGLSWAQDDWTSIAKAGVCTMDPGIGKWLRESSAMELPNSHNSNTMSLKGLVAALDIKLPRGRFHTADFDAYLHAQAYRALVSKMKECALTDPLDKSSDHQS